MKPVIKLSAILILSFLLQILVNAFEIVTPDLELKKNSALIIFPSKFKDNENFPEEFGSHSSKNSDGGKITGNGTPNIKVSWLKGSLSGNHSNFTGWQTYYWDNPKGKSHVVQCDFANSKKDDSYLEIRLTGENGKKAILDSFELLGWQGHNSKVTWQVFCDKFLKPKATGQITLDNSTVRKKVNLSSEISGGIVAIRLFHNDGDPTDLAMDNLKFAQLP